MSSKIFISKLEELIPAEELLFDPTPAFGDYKPFLEHAIPHPAKANTRLLEFLIENFTRRGETILDPMAGSGSTGVVAALHGRNAIQIELEKKFFEWMEEARCRVENTPTLAPKGKIINILGDARHLSELLNQNIDYCLTSPPYSESLTKKRKGYTIIRGLERSREMPQDTRDDNIANLPHGEISAIITSLPCGDTNLSGGDPETSPPYSDSPIGGGLNTKSPKHPNQQHGRSPFSPSQLGAGRYSDNPNNIGNLPHGSIDVILTSPPYSNVISRQGGETKIENVGISTKTAREYSQNRENIGNLPHGDIEKMCCARILDDENFEIMVKKLMKNGKPTYLSEMLKVYREMWKVLKPNGLAIIIVKPFVREKKVVDLPFHTHILLSTCGFVLEKLYKLRLKHQSFWRRLYAEKYPDVPLIQHEYVLVYRKLKNSLNPCKGEY
ncbi:MAG: DNA methyltransferase [Nitrososphaeria archaeon]